ncbi:hypothetical protein HS961_15265 [Comamonas piscis]|uniref:Uncharacterized protein n=1 Tax=Comamonas piscis TaxID=1562974 RepID=A0A7G5EJB1_9BURK|nr:hypothetical protein [Comamonas piscis]QMV74086.1 hypothetical protein HS961_15265 [Comamonas piscis]WSO32524.1 hypothetical protein VUJ63_15310 [Comamonas piscis]
MTQNAPLLSPEVCETLFDGALERHQCMEVHCAPGLAHQLNLAARFVAQQAVDLPKPYAGCLMFFTITAQNLPITSFSIQQPSIAAAWDEGAARLRQWAWAFNASSVELRIDWATAVLPLPGDDPQDALADLSKSWSLADNAQERAEMLALLSHRMTRSLARLQLLSDPVPASTQGRWQLLLEGLHISPLGEMRTLPRYDPSAPRNSHGSAASAIYQATQDLLARSQSEDGSWPEASTLIDHLGISYALLLTQRQGGPTEASSMTVHRAIAYQVEQMQRWSLHECGSDLLKAMSLIVLVQYVHLYPGAGCATPLRDLIGLLSQQLHGKAGRGAVASAPWAQLALQSLQKSGQQPSEGQAPDHSALDGDSQWLHAAWQQLQALAHDEEHSKLHPEPWVSAALMECSMQHGKPLFASHAQRSQFLSGMQSLFKTCYQRMVWPKLPHLPASRQRHAPVTDCRVASQLLITISAAVNFSSLSQAR